MDKNCKICHTVFKVKPSHYDKRFCCNVKCRNIDKKNATDVNNPNFKNGGKSQECVICKSLFKTNHYHKVKCCSHECITKLKKHINTKSPEQAVIALKAKQAASKIVNNLKRTCKCGNTKESKSSLCRSCFHSSIKSTSKCLICGTEFKKIPQKVCCSKKCSTINLKSKTGDKNHNWKGGIKTENQKERASDKYKDWRNSVFKRDNYKCQHCGVGGNLHAHHIKSFSKHKDLRTEISNGISLCKTCHNKHHRKHGYS